LKHLFSSWADRADQTNQPYPFLSDYDGTLTPIVEKPNGNHLRTPGCSFNHWLMRAFTVGIISGRAMADLKEKVNIEGIIYAETMDSKRGRSKLC
jgi:trehalose-6-phosphatase